MLPFRYYYHSTCSTVYTPVYCSEVYRSANPSSPCYYSSKGPRVALVCAVNRRKWPRYSGNGATPHADTIISVAKMSFDKLFDLTVGVHFYFYNKSGTYS